MLFPAKLAFDHLVQVDFVIPVAEKDLEILPLARLNALPDRVTLALEHLRHVAFDLEVGEEAGSRHTLLPELVDSAGLLELSHLA